MIETDLNRHLSKLDAYIMQSIELVETASELYGKLIDNNITKSEFADSIKDLSDELNTIYVEITSDFSIDHLAPDPFQKLDSSFYSFISMCDNYMKYDLSRLGENGRGDHWSINKTIEGLQRDYKKLLEWRKNSEVLAVSECQIPKVIILNSKSRNFEAMRQTLRDKGFVCIKLELSSDVNLAQLNIELVTGDSERRDLVDLAFKCFQVIKDDLASLSHVKAVFMGFRIGDRKPYSWLRIETAKILKLLSNTPSIEKFERIIEFHYVEDIISAEQVLVDLATHLSALKGDFEVKEALMIVSEQLEITKKACANPDPLVDLIIRWSFSRSLLSCISVVLEVVSVTRDPDAARTILSLFNMYRKPDEIDSSRDYSNLLSEISDLIETLKFRYVVLPKVRKISFGSSVKPSSRIALIQPKISFDECYIKEGYALNRIGLDRNLKIFDDMLDQAVQNDADAIVFPEIFFPVSELDHLKMQSEKNNIIIITGLDYEKISPKSFINSCAVALPDGRVIRQKKLFKSKYDSPLMVEGDELVVFETPIGNFSVFICYDYLSAQDLIKLKGVIDTLFVLTFNPDVGSYHEKAIADAYSTLYGFICIVNVFDPDHSPKILGRSGSYGPYKGNKVITRFGDAEHMGIVELPLHDLHEARKGSESSIMKALPANFNNVSLAKDYPKEAIDSIRQVVLMKIKEEKRRTSREGKKDYESLKEQNISQELESDLDKQKYAIMELEPVHTGAAKRLSAFLLIKKGLSKSQIKSIIQAANEDLKKRECYSNKIQEVNHKGKPADVVWLYIFNERRHRNHLAASDFYDYFVCRTQWIHPNFDQRFSPLPLNGDEIVDNIEIKWNKNYPI
ncbi:carbon-nitrogen hydrolase family protein [Candidatus Methanocrinis natronophilus]|uniref:Carbon-nitrogen hydrolase family protein n=1 Tax=Candidatus Methanocrinis natronophilus TaxID=3033396 RepID=A0ABT5XA54_9EURY|nr:carbon-nitrogen hydrolase family protein [Candidatus Methanocrinis natronophilus]MDF0591588.1 carbon-nitrogen hydrolase family protein [Candidatus Methanocrinis natronophilus]